MWFVAVGVVMVVLNLVGVGPTAAWNWDLGFENGEITGDLWKFVLPFLLAVVWWTWSDLSGMTRRREMQRDDERKSQRRRHNIEAMGLQARKPGASGRGTQRRR